MSLNNLEVIDEENNVQQNSDQSLTNVDKRIYEENDQTVRHVEEQTLSEYKETNYTAIFY